MSPRGVNLENVTVVLHQPRLSENIGTAARAASNMGLGSLIAVQPNQIREDILMASATKGGQRLIENMSVYENLPDALAVSQENKIAIVFGPERTGLTTVELRLCQAVVSIPTNSKTTSSINLAQAVLIVGYELLLAESDETLSPPIKMAPVGEVQAMYDHFKRALLELGFLPEENSDYWIMNFARIFNRAGLTHEDCNLQILRVTEHVPWPKKTAAPKLEGNKEK
ncbi:MAG: hypothetical protein JRJ73_12375 [Deltaproteobacteria bacterium]|nr:hypothetical protein [Deltaproteobacteria bacterium]